MLLDSDPCYAGTQGFSLWWDRSTLEIVPQCHTCVLNWYCLWRLHDTKMVLPCYYA